MGHAFRFDADLPHKIGGREKRQQQGGDYYGTDDGLRAIQGEISGPADEGYQNGKEPPDRKLQQLDCADGRGSYTEGNQFGPDRDPTVAKQGVAKSHVHKVKPAYFFRKEKGT